MKKFLLSTTVLAGASLFSSGVFAQAVFEAADDIQDGASPVVQNQPAFAVRISGTVRVSARWVDQDQQGMYQAFDLNDDAVDLAINGSATADNGLSYGFVMDVDDEEGELHLSNRFGRLTFGTTNSASNSLDITGGTVLVGRGGWSNGGDKNVMNTVGGLRQVTVVGDDGGTIRYSTPNYGGLTIAASFTNETDGSMMDGDAGFEDVLSFGGQYTSSYGNYTTVVYIGYETSNRAVKSQGTLTAGSDSALENQDVTIFSVGAKVTGMGAGFAIGYGEVEVDTAAGTPGLDVAWYDAALSFSSGPWSISGGGAYVKKDDASNPGGAVLNQDQVMKVFALTTNYALAPGLALSAGVAHYDIENENTGNAKTNNSATTFTLATTMSF